MTEIRAKYTNSYIFLTHTHTEKNTQLRIDTEKHTHKLRWLHRIIFKYHRQLILILFTLKIAVVTLIVGIIGFITIILDDFQRWTRSYREEICGGQIVPQPFWSIHERLWMLSTRKGCIRSAYHRILIFRWKVAGLM